LGEAAVISASRPRRHAWIAWVFIGLAVLVGAPFARAGTVGSDGTTLTFTAGAGEANHLLVLQTPEGFRIVDNGAALTAGSGCASVAANEAFCDMDQDIALNADISAGNMDDLVSVSGSNVEVTLNGGDDGDTLEINTACGFCEDGGTNHVLGGPGADDLSSALGTNYLDGGADGDTISGGIADYSSRTNGVVVDTDGAADDGETGEGDNVKSSVYFVLGGSGNDDITASAADGGDGDDKLTGTGTNCGLFGGHGDDELIALGNDCGLFGDQDNDKLVGGPGFDYLEGDAGNDTLSGRARGDTLVGGGGADTLRGEAGNDVLSGNQGNDKLNGGTGRDRFFGGGGNDTLLARDGERDRVNGNSGTDRGHVDGGGLDVVISVEQFF
jgi:Ca2+-binding RTX toxin-like protein